jgi:hypothetical protein
VSRRHFAGRSVIRPRSDESVAFAVCQAGVDNELGMAVSYAVPAWEAGRSVIGCLAANPCRAEAQYEEVRIARLGEVDSLAEDKMVPGIDRSGGMPGSRIGRADEPGRSDLFSQGG